MGDSVALAGDSHHLRAERGGDELRRVIRGVGLPLDQGGHGRAVGAIECLVYIAVKKRKKKEVEFGACTSWIHAVYLTNGKPN